MLDYFDALARWAELGPEIYTQLGLYCPLKFSGAIADWYRDLSDDVRPILLPHEQYQKGPSHSVSPV